MMDQLFSFFQTNGVIFELIICNMLFSFPQKRRNLYPLRLLLSASVMILSAILLNLRQIDSVFYNLFKYIVWYLLGLCGTLFIYDVSFRVSTFIGVGAFISQHVSFKVGEIMLYFLPDSLPSGTRSIAYVCTLAIMYTFSYFVFARRFKRLNVHHAKQNQLLLLYLAVAVYITVLQFYFADYVDTISTELYLIYASFDIICCMFAMMLQFGIIETSSLKEESKLMEHVLFMQHEKYRLSKETIDLINIKFHDLKKQMLPRAMDEQEAQELYQTLNIYDMAVKSGNEALDIVLAEKSLLCEQQHIRLECIADGERLSFMSTSDVYSLIGNAIDNAIESVLKVQEHAERFINISIKDSRNLLVIRIENPFCGELEFRDGLPVTTKEDKSFHGFGMKSIQKVVEKYNGFFSIDPKDHLFVLNIVFMPRT
ncbi:MAG: ATP-binding protein [Aristaeellaceae bacterium]